MKKVTKITLITSILIISGIVGYGIYYFCGSNKQNSNEQSSNEMSIEQRLEESKEYCKKHHLQQDYCCFVDFSIPANKERFFIYDLRTNQCVHKGIVAHGKGGKSTRLKADFSTKQNSHCSMPGKIISNYNQGRIVGKSYILDGRNLLMLLQDNDKF